MIKIGEKYRRKDKPEGIKIKPFEFKDGKVSYSHEGYFDWREIPVDLFLERYELEPEIKY